MPIYEYRCQHCGHGFELIQRFSDEAQQPCPQCGKTADRQMSAPAFQFKGSGWYLTDYAKKNSPSPSSSSSETKTETKSETK